MSSHLLLLAACVDPTAPATASAGCPAGEFLDGEACVPYSCGTGTWSDVEGDYFVGPGDSIQSAADEAGAAGGGVVAVAAGAYVESLVLTEAHDGVQIAGRCAEMVVIDGSAGNLESGCAHQAKARSWS